MKIFHAFLIRYLIVKLLALHYLLRAKDLVLTLHKRFECMQTNTLVSLISVLSRTNRKLQPESRIVRLYPMIPNTTVAGMVFWGKSFAETLLTQQYQPEQAKKQDSLRFSKMGNGTQRRKSNKKSTAARTSASAEYPQESTTYKKMVTKSKAGKKQVRSGSIKLSKKK